MHYTKTLYVVLRLFYLKLIYTGVLYILDVDFQVIFKQAFFDTEFRKMTKFKTLHPLFTESKNFFSNYLVPLDKFETEFSHDTNLALPLVVDSEFVAHGVEKFLEDDFQYRSPVTIQVKHIHHPDEQIFVHPEFFAAHPDKTFRHPIAKHPFIIGDYLESKGHTVEMWRDENARDSEDKKPMLLVPIYAHFALADLGMVITDPVWLEDLKTKYARGHIEMSRRVTCGQSGRALFDWFISIDGNEYRISIKVIDTCAIHGIASYANFCSNSGVALDAKDKMKAWITKMDDAYFEVPDDFDEYSLGDLKVYDALVGNAENMRVVWRDLDILDYYKPPKLSIGSTVASLLEAKIFDLFDAPPDMVHDRSFKKDEFLEPLTGKATAEFLSQKVDSNAYTLSKCDGGRCKSNNPLATAIHGILVDIDIAGAYSSAMSVIYYPFGTPTILATPYKNRDNNKGVSLKKVLRAYGSELVDDLWLMRIQVKNLSYEQDLIASWVDFNRTIVRKADSDLVGGEVDLESGESKIFTTEIFNGALTADLLNVVDQWNPRQRDDFYSKCEVLAIAFYPKSLELTVEDFKQSKTEKSFKSKSRASNDFHSITQGNHQWCRVRLGEFFTDIMRAKRVQHKKKTPLNEMYKLLGNTSYGVSVSRFFGTSNMIVGNVITGKVRAGMWLFEKGLNLYGSITDGQVFDLDNVLHRKDGKYLKTESLARLYSIPKWQFSDNDSGEFAPLVRPPRTDDLNHDQQIIDALALEHVGKVWSKSKLLHDEYDILTPIDGRVLYTKEKGAFRFEMKQFTDLVVLHGSSNYSFNPDDVNQTKMRSYEGKRPHQSFTLVNDEIVPTDEYDGVSPAQCLLSEIHNNPHSVRRLPPFVKTAILKPTAYKNEYRNKWSKSPLTPGDNILKVGKPNYFSLAAFTYKTHAQYTAWKKASDKLKRKYGESFEIFFNNDDDTINYQKMLIEIDALIQTGIIDPLAHFDPHRHLNRIRSSVIGASYFQASKILKTTVSDCFISEDYEDTSRFDNNEWD